MVARPWNVSPHGSAPLAQSLDATRRPRPLAVARASPVDASIATSTPLSHPESSSLVGPTISGHADAVARRKEHERRKAARSAALAELTASDCSWWEVGTPANMVLVESAADFEHGLRKALSTYSLVVVDYFAPWCHACRSLYPKLRQIAAQHDDVMFLKANCAADDMREMCERDSVRGLPYFRFHATGCVLGEFPANLHKVGRLRKEIANMKMRVAAS